jgi:hypothetical protein
MFTSNQDGTSFQRIYSIGEGQYGFSNVVFSGYGPALRMCLDRQ